MRLIIKFYNEWGKMASVQVNVSSKGRVDELKIAVAKQTNIAVSEQEINVVNGDTQFQLDENDKYLSDYELTEKCILYVLNKADEFSFEIPHHSGFTSVELSENNLSKVKIDAPNFSIESISVRGTVKEYMDVDDPFSTKYNEVEFKNFLYAMIESVKRLDLEVTKLYYRLHKEKLLGLIDDTKEQVDQESFKIQFDILNDTQHFNWSIVNLATFVGSDKILLWCLSEGGDYKQETTDGWDCILIAIWQGNYQVLTLLLGQLDLDINKASMKGPPLHLAASVDDPHSVKILLAHPKINLLYNFGYMKSTKPSKQKATRSSWRLNQGAIIGRGEANSPQTCD